MPAGRNVNLGLRPGAPPKPWAVRKAVSNTGICALLAAIICAKRCRREASASIVSEMNPMLWVRKVLMRMFGRPKGALGRLGGVIMARVNRDAAAQVIEVVDVRPDDKVLEVGVRPGVACQRELHRDTRRSDA